MKHQDPEKRPEQEQSRPAVQDTVAIASALQNEIDFYRQTAKLCKKRAKRKIIAACCILIGCVLATLCVLVMALLAFFKQINPLSPVFFYAISAAILLLLLLGLCFFVGSRDDKSLLLDCEARIAERKKKLRAAQKQIEEERRLAEEENLRAVAVLSSVPKTRAQKLAHALRVTSAVLSALSIPVGAIATLCKEKKKKRK